MAKKNCPICGGDESVDFHYGQDGTTTIICPCSGGDKEELKRESKLFDNAVNESNCWAFS